MTSNAGIEFNVFCLKTKDICQPLIDDWRELEKHSLDDNIFLSSGHLLPAIRHLENTNNNIVIIVAYHSKLDEKRLCALGVFEKYIFHKYFPLPHLKAYKSRHSYLTGLLLDAEFGEAAALSLIKFINDKMPYIFAIRFIDMAADLKSTKIVRQSIKTMKGKEYILDLRERAMLTIDENTAYKTIANISKKRIKNYKKAKRELAEHGELRWILKFGDLVDQETINTFLELEDTGWKEISRNSLMSSDKNKAFFLEMIYSLLDTSRVFFTELTLNNKVIASTCNLLSGNTAFAFKVGWDPVYKWYSPGILNEIEFLYSLNNNEFLFSMIDSGASPDSFINSYWHERRQLFHIVFTINKIGILVGGIITYIKRLKNKFT